MKKLKFILVLFLSASVFIGCSSDGDGGDSIDTVTLTTKAATLNNSNFTIQTGGNFSSNFGNSENYEVGVCTSNLPNPTIADPVAIFGGFSQEFTVFIQNATFGTTYYIRAYALNLETGTVKYGNEVSIAIPLPISTGIAKNISCSSFTVDVTVGSEMAANDERGICYSTSHNPTINNQTFSNSTSGAGSFSTTVTNPSASYYLHVGTVYYLRSYARVNGAYYYGNEITFRMAGFIGGSGGYVFYDKGETTNGWRYLEAASNYLINPSGSNEYFMWNNCNSNSFLAGISNDIGTGAENSVAIKNDCNFTNNAASMAKYVSQNGMSDWFLPSLEELKMLYTLKRENLMSYNSSVYPLLSSSQQANNTAYAVFFNNGSQTGWFKSDASRVWQVRRF